MPELYPITVIFDRYSGCYSGGEWTAWNEYPEDIPEGPFADDVTCADFWESWADNDDGCYPKPIGQGPNAQSAIEDLIAKVQERV